MASEAAKARMARIGAFMDELNSEADAEAGRRTPGENIEIGLRLGDFARAAAQHPPEEKVKVPLIRLWRELQAQKKSQ